MTAVLEVRDVSVRFATDRGDVSAVDGASFAVRQGEILGLVGESGSGKSVTATAILGLLRRPGRLAGGSIVLGGRELTTLGEQELQKIRGVDVTLISQTPRTALNPLITVGRQVARLFTIHAGLGKAEARRRAIEMLTLVGIPEPERRAGQYAHQFSGGMCQRVMIALAISCNPRLLIADEPTTALDVTVQKQVLDLLDRLRRQRDMAMLLITHDLGVVAGYADRAVVMYLGQLVEQAPVNELFAAPAHPYTRALLNAMPDIDQQNARLPSIAGSVPDLHERPVGCAFAPRCEYADARCREQPPQAVEITPGRAVRCWKPLNETQA